jgi:uncharacterized membrane protein YfcA
MSNEADPPTTDPDQRPKRPKRPVQLFTTGEVMRIIAAAVLAGLAIGYLLARWDGDTLEVLARIFGIVAMLAVLQMIFEARRRRHIMQVRDRLDRIEEKLDSHFDAELVGFNRGYLTCLKDRGQQIDL